MHAPRLLARLLYSVAPPLFLIPQGTSILALLIHHTPYQFPYRVPIATTIFLLSFALLCIFVLTYTLRTLLFPSSTKRQLLNPPVAACALLSSLVALESNTSYLALLNYHAAAHILFWIEAVLSVLTFVALTYALMLLPRSRTHLPPVLLLPVIAVITAAATGSVVAPTSPAVKSASLVILGFGVPFAFGYSFYYGTHLLSGSYTPATRKEGMAAVLLIGPFGQAAFALIRFGEVGNAELLFFGYACLWVCIGTAEMVRMVFLVGGGARTWRPAVVDWQVLFPVGVFANAAEELAYREGLLGWRIFATIWVCIYGAMWVGLVVEGVWVFGRLLGSLGTSEEEEEENEDRK